MVLDVEVPKAVAKKPAVLLADWAALDSFLADLDSEKSQKEATANEEHEQEEDQPQDDIGVDSATSDDSDEDQSRYGAPLETGAPFDLPEQGSAEDSSGEETPAAEAPAAEEPATEDPPKKGFFARLFGR